MTRSEKEKVLERIYYDVDEGFGSVRDLYEKARKVDVYRHNFGDGIYMDEGATEQANKKLQELQFLHCSVSQV